MNYVQAIEQATLGKCVMRPHWCAVKIKYDPSELRSFVVDIDGDEEIKCPYRPTQNDLTATDWMLAPGDTDDHL